MKKVSCFHIHYTHNSISLTSTKIPKHDKHWPHISCWKHECLTLHWYLHWGQTSIKKRRQSHKGHFISTIYDAFGRLFTLHHSSLKVSMSEIISLAKPTNKLLPLWENLMMKFHEMCCHVMCNYMHRCHGESVSPEAIVVWEP